MAEKRARQSQEDKEESKKNEVCFGAIITSGVRRADLSIRQSDVRQRRRFRILRKTCRRKSK
jgi:hypothetical protein